MMMSESTAETSQRTSSKSLVSSQEEQMIFQLSHTLYIDSISDHTKCMQIVCSYLQEEDMFRIISRLSREMQGLIINLFQTQERVRKITLDHLKTNLKESQYALMIYPDVELVLGALRKGALEIFESFLQRGKDRPENLHNSQISVKQEFSTVSFDCLMNKVQTILNQNSFKKEMKSLEIELLQRNEDLFQLLMKNIYFTDVQINYDNQIEFDGFKKDMNTECIRSLKLEKFKGFFTYMNWQFNGLPNLEHIQLGVRDLRQISRIDFTRFKHLKRVCVEYMQTVHLNDLYKFSKQFLDQLPKLKLDELHIQQTYAGIVERYAPERMVDILEILQTFSKLSVDTITISATLGRSSKIKLPSCWIDAIGSSQPSFYHPNQVFSDELLQKFRKYKIQNQSQEEIDEFLSKPVKLGDATFHMTNLERLDDFDALMSFSYQMKESNSPNFISIKVKCPLQMRNLNQRTGQLIADLPNVAEAQAEGAEQNQHHNLRGENILRQMHRMHPEDHHQHHQIPAVFEEVERRLDQVQEGQEHILEEEEKESQDQEPHDEFGEGNHQNNQNEAQIVQTQFAVLDLNEVEAEEVADDGVDLSDVLDGMKEASQESGHYGQSQHNY